MSTGSGAPGSWGREPTSDKEGDVPICVCRADAYSGTRSGSAAAAGFLEEKPSVLGLSEREAAERVGAEPKGGAHGCAQPGQLLRREVVRAGPRAPTMVAETATMKAMKAPWAQRMKTGCRGWTPMRVERDDLASRGDHRNR